MERVSGTLPRRDRLLTCEPVISPVTMLFVQHQGTYSATAVWQVSRGGDSRFTVSPRDDAWRDELLLTAGTVAHGEFQTPLGVLTWVTARISL